MIDSTAYRWQQIEQGAEATLPLRHYPFLGEALQAQGVEIDLDWPADTVRRVCGNLLRVRCVLTGEDD